MPKLKLTKNELRQQKDSLKMFQHYLPSLLLKKQQLQLEILKIHNLLDEIDAEEQELKALLSQWVAVFAEEVGFEELLRVEEVFTKPGNVAGVDIPVFDKVTFTEKEYSFSEFPIWVDYGIDTVKQMFTLKARRMILKRQIDLLREELRVTTQRVNLFEKVKIPETKGNIKKISIWLGDMQTAAVVTGKIAKTKIQKKEGALV